MTGGTSPTVSIPFAGKKAFPEVTTEYGVRRHDATTSIFTGRRNNSFDSTEAGASTTSSSDSSREDSSDVINGHYVNKEDTLIIFDWDDTIFPTRYLTVQWGLRVDGPSPPPALMAALNDYAVLVKDTLLTALEFGTVIIVTNAEAGWIPLTCAKFLPSLLPTLNNIHHISARTTYEPQGFASAFEWKDQSFKQAISEHFSSSPVTGRRRCVISLGDSAHERLAVINACHVLNELAALKGCGKSSQLLCKSLKFMEKPDLEHLKKVRGLVTFSRNNISSKAVSNKLSDTTKIWTCAFNLRVVATTINGRSTIKVEKKTVAYYMRNLS
ncbi:apicomplexan-conserved protein, putative [Perkinsus marinus ATCC 50983]|uniref:Apicomplexan-conserved protein, putative n=1 Tax=Perkinsus marinus (strain ATCC 50983 / TXsc) TaxID=423536 RepID=C5M198_PERM5|nr:apicomplexan-conserved protein, putative [Perkinsus marinus ATCC 50983]EEQ97220.1 apicomplexan-conserved protein, putative [Perkinsus marinus ATCC 50983]|eukprot:XP_002764503.1 apicomplexan-conserved protein, putative [Perkinsus marinus ATCC 50983]